ncbi:hypothetical protein M6B38_294185 [Iris pallida]|uniref:Uncharacterized protein n=1 Tax=Iris pallida TaxID=29817 RepID=A0AAX6FA15_IRIPA|nr:hypothetical protein M6B38_147405 [Iris pallida]KAJ6844882.1 hypothetical protein M6B38_294185 [Iris pallida]
MRLGLGLKLYCVRGYMTRIRVDVKCMVCVRVLGVEHGTRGTIL